MGRIEAHTYARVRHGHSKNPFDCGGSDGQIEDAAAALYVRVSANEHTIENQVRVLTKVVERKGWALADANIYRDEGVSGAKGHDKRPGFDALLNAAVRRKIDVIAVWSSDRLGRSLSQLVEVLQHIKETGTGLYIDTQAIDTTTSSGRMMFGMLAVFGEFEREMIASRVQAGLDRTKAALAKDGKFTSRKGIVRSRLGRPSADANKLDCARQQLAEGIGIIRVAKAVGLGVGTVHRLKREMHP